MVNRDKLEETTDRNEYQTGRPESAPEREKKNKCTKSIWFSFSMVEPIFTLSQSTDYKVIPTIYNQPVR